MNRKLKFLLLISLLANLLLVGIFLGFASHRLMRHVGPPPMQDEAMEKLSPKLRAQMKDHMKSLRKEGRADHREIRAVKEEIVAILSAKEFDDEAFDQQVERMYELRGVQAKRKAEAIKSLAISLPQEQRRALATMLRHPPRRHR